MLHVRTITLLLALASTLAAAGVTGKWKGTIKTDGGEGMPAYMALEQSGNTVTGKAGGSETMVFNITLGKLEGDRLTIEASPRAGTVLRFVLTLKGDTLGGDAHENGNYVGAVSLMRAP